MEGSLKHYKEISFNLYKNIATMYIYFIISFQIISRIEKSLT